MPDRTPATPDPLARSHPLVRDWFASRFDGPTEPQASGWPAIADGHNTLIAAPTGSGKTLAAFLNSIDSLVRSGLDGGLPDRTEVVYVSPLKALSNDIERNLSEPLAGIQALAESRGIALPEIRAAVRTGDTPQSQRQAMAKRPPHILITTPESLYILLTSQSGRASLSGARTLILDELHAVADDKRGAHLSLSAERLCALADGPVTRIGLSATQRPIEEMARFLVGMNNLDSDGKPDCRIVDAGHRRDVDLALELVEGEIGPIATHEQWDQALDRVAELVRAHGTTLLFVNTRRLVERLSHELSMKLGEDSVVAHHGSLAKETRQSAEKRLKAGDVKLCVATSSLELGIDIGSIELVCQVGSPRSIGLLIQRVGRSGHWFGGTSKGRLFPLTRDDLMESLALVRAVRTGNLDRLAVPSWPMDVLAQQIVAECGSREWNEDELFDLARSAYPYRDLPREEFDRVVDILSSGVAPRLGRSGAYVFRDGVNHRLRGRRGARLAALTSGGAIPDNADYDVIAEPDGVFVGTVNEDFATESMRGDVFLLGNTPWRIRRLESGKLRVEDAQGANPTIPFWLGEAPGRTTELSDEVSELREEIYDRLDGGRAVDWLIAETGCGRDAAEQASAYVEEGVRILGTVPTKSRIVAERFFDDSGGMQLVVHSPFGSHINRAWGMALRKEICRTFDFELQASATEDGINLSLGPSLSFPISETFSYVTSGKARKSLTQAILQAPIFQVRWRWVVTRSLAVLRFSSGRKVPPPLLRMRSDDLLAAVFPEQVACQDNAPPGDIEVPDHPLVFETMRDCLTEAMDIDGLEDVLRGIEEGRIEVFARDTVQPSAFSHQILNAMPYAFLDDDGEIAERRSRAVSLRRALPEDQRELGTLDAAAIERAARDAWPLVRDADELHDALLTLGMLPEGELGLFADSAELERRQGWLNTLVQGRRVTRAEYGAERAAWVAAERVARFAAAFPEAQFHPTPPVLDGRTESPTGDEAELALVRGRIECSGPFTPDEMSQFLGMSKGAVDIALAHIEATGGILRGHFSPGQSVEQFCDRRILSRIHRETIGRLRKEIEAVPPATYIKFLFRWQHVGARWRVSGDGGLLEVIDQLQGFESPAAAWESDILSQRVGDYKSTLLDELCLSGEIAWGRFSGRDGFDDRVSHATLARNVPISLALRDSVHWLMSGPVDANGLVGAQAEVLAFLDQWGASFLPDIAGGTRRLPSDVERALWELTALGRVTADGFGVVRGVATGATQRASRSPRYRRRRARRSPSSRWSLLRSASPWDQEDRPGLDDVELAARSRERTLEARSMQLLQRYGIVFPEVLAREEIAPRWRDLLRVYRRAEARGEIRGGRFVEGFVGEQFALPEAVETLRNVNKAPPDTGVSVVSACDPLNVVGILTSGPRVTAVLGNAVAFKDGVPVASLQGGELAWLSEVDEDTRQAVIAKLSKSSPGAPELALAKSPGR